MAAHFGSRGVWWGRGSRGVGVYVVFMARRTTAAAFGLKPDVGNASLSFVLYEMLSRYVSFIQNIICDLNMKSFVLRGMFAENSVGIHVVCLAYLTYMVEEKYI